MISLSARDGRRRVVIENVQPEIDGGRFAAKRVIGDSVDVQADVFLDGQEIPACMLRYRHESESDWHEAEMLPVGNDVWQAAFVVSQLGRYFYSMTAWIDSFVSWQRELTRRKDAVDIAIALQTGVLLVEAAALRTDGESRMLLMLKAESLRGANVEAGLELALSTALTSLMRQYPDRAMATDYAKTLVVLVEPVKARFSTWYEFFPRSCTDDSSSHGSLANCEKLLPYIADMGFDVVYLPPIHPIGLSKRKGANNALEAGEANVGSPWAIGNAAGGHKVVHPQLGTLDDFRRFVTKAKALGVDVAMDMAFQCSPDHPYLQEHPEWFRHKPDGSVQYAENPPKKYEDIYPFNFDCETWRELWQELLEVVLFWISQGICMFRVDNPHTKPFAFWEWLLGEVKSNYPETIFLAEAFTRPKIVYRLAKLGFSQSYNYFPWRNTKSELQDYFTELMQVELRQYFRPNLWPNTPDILSEYLQFGGRPAFMARLVLAATLGASYGIYGPAYELMESVPREPGAEEYLNSEKYQLHAWDLERPDSLQDFIARVNRIRRENFALQHDDRLHFVEVDNDALLSYAKISPDNTEIILVVVNLDPHHSQSGWVILPMDSFGLDVNRPYQMHDLLTGARFIWSGARNYVEITPKIAPAHMFKIRRHVRTERDFDYFM